MSIWKSAFEQLIWIISSVRTHHVMLDSPSTRSKVMLDESTYQLFLAVSNFKLSAKHPNEKFIWCPNSSCGQAILIEHQKEAALGYRSRKSCPTCATLVCLDCCRLFHGSLPCDTAESLRSTQQTEDLGIVRWMKDQGDRVKLCPRCREAIEKTDGWYGSTLSFIQKPPESK